MIYFTRTFLFLFFIFSFFLDSQSQENNKNEVYNKLKASYGNLTSIEFKFFCIEFHDLNGQILAKKGNKYILKVQEREIYCDGKSIWNYTEEDNKVIISEYEENDQNSLENIFFTFLEKYQPEKLVKEQSSKGLSSYVLTLNPKQNDSQVSGIEQIMLWLNPKNFEINRIRIDINNSLQTYDIRDLRKNQKIKDSAFTFKPEKDTKVIDLR